MALPKKFKENKIKKERKTVSGVEKKNRDVFGINGRNKKKKKLSSFLSRNLITIASPREERIGFKRLKRRVCVFEVSTTTRTLQRSDANIDYVRCLLRIFFFSFELTVAVRLSPDVTVFSFYLLIFVCLFSDLFIVAPVMRESGPPDAWRNSPKPLKRRPSPPTRGSIL